MARELRVCIASDMDDTANDTGAFACTADEALAVARSVGLYGADMAVTDELDQEGRLARILLTTPVWMVYGYDPTSFPYRSLQCP